MENMRIFLLLQLLATITFAYDIGVTHHYKYDTSVVVNEECTDTDDSDSIGHGLKAKVQLTAVWQDKKSQKKLMKIQVTEPKLLVSKKSVLEERKSDLEEISAPESFFLLQNNRVEKFWDNPAEHHDLRNLKRSVATLLQVGRKDGEEKMDCVSGKCEVLYKIEGKTVRRSIGNCHHPLQDSVLSQPYGVRSSSVQRSTGIDCDLKDSDIVSKCLAVERLKTYSNLWKRSSVCIKSITTFAFERTSESDEVFKLDDYNKVINELQKKGELLEGSIHSVSRNSEGQKLANILDSTKSFQESLKAANLAKLKSASAFFKLLPLFRAAKKEDIIKVLENKKFAKVLPQILDLVAGSSSKDSVQAALTYFGKVEDYDENLERFLISLSVLPRPESFILEEIKAFLEKGSHHEKIEATLIATMGTLLRTYSKTDQIMDTKVAEKILSYLESGLKNCKTDACILNYLRGLRNAALKPSFPLLLQYALRGGKPSLEALLALRGMPTLHVSRENQEALLKVFHQVGAKQDRSSRAIAAEILLKGNADDDILKSVLASLSDQSDVEFSSFVVSKVLRLMDESKRLKSRLLKLLTEKEISHYYSLSQKGKSSLFKRQLMSTEGLNVTYGIEMELMEGGLLKRSSFDVEFETDFEVSNLLSVGMFAEGMGSFAGESSPEDAADPTAGMELTLLGSSLRPYVFFSSTSELMSHAWSGTASEPTPALQGIFSLCDDNHLVILHNGMVVRLELRGAMSADMSASIQISLWYKSSQSHVKNSAALLVKGSAVVDSQVAKTRGEYQFYGHSNIDFGTDLEFSDSPFKMCLQMEHPNVVLRHDFQKGVEVNEAKFSMKKTKKRKRFIPSRSYALHQNNNELCRIMKSSDSE